MIIWVFIVGLFLALFTSISLKVCISRAPEIFNKWFGFMFGLVALSGFIGGIILIVLSCNPLF